MRCKHCHEAIYLLDRNGGQQWATHNGDVDHDFVCDESGSDYGVHEPAK